MAAPLSVDLRKRIVEARTREGLTYEQLAARFGVGRATVDRLLRRWRETGSVEPNQMGGNRGRLIEDESVSVLQALVEEAPDRTLPDLVEAFESRTGIRVSRATMGRAVARAGLTRKKRRSVPNSATEPT